MDRLKGKIALITGAGTGVGRACMPHCKKSPGKTNNDSAIG